MDTIRLKNGTEMPGSLVRAVMVSLRTLCKSAPLAFHDLVMFCRDGAPPFIGWVAMEKHAFGLVVDGQVHGSIRNVIISEVEGDGPGMRVGNPAAE